MEQGTIYARVIPKTVRVTETYAYEATVARNEVCELKGLPRGLVEILVPYCGHEHFTAEAIADIEHRHRDIWPEGRSKQIRIGYLGFSDYKATDLDERLALADASDVAPVDVPVSAESLNTRLDLLDGRQACRVSLDYTPEAPQPHPIKLDFDIFDEDDLLAGDRLERQLKSSESLDKDVIEKKLYEELLRLSAAGNDAAPPTSLPQDMLEQLEALKQEIRDNAIQAEKELSEVLQRPQTSAERRILLGFDIILHLPERASLFEPPAMLKRMSLTWPTTITDCRMELEATQEWFRYQDPKSDMIYSFTDYLEETVKYVPERNAIEWGGIPFLAPAGKTKGLKLFRHVAHLMLSVKEPGELFREEVLRGELEVTVPTALSGLKVDYFGADGRKSSLLAKSQSSITLKFELNLEDPFDHKFFLPRQHLEFGGVILEDRRVSDVITVLQNEGFETRRPSVLVVAEDNATKRELIVGEKVTVSGPMKLWILLEGHQSGTRRRKAIPGGQEFITEVEAGHLVVHMLGFLEGDSTQVFDTMNRIKETLRQRFPYVSKMD